MPRVARKLAMVRGRVARVTRLDGCARPVIGEYNQAVTDGVITATFTANQSDTDEISVTNMNGKRCIYEPSLPELSGYSVDVQFCSVEPEVFEIITGQTLVFGADGTVLGLEIDTQIKLGDKGFALEIFAGSAATDACDDEQAEGQYGYLLLPRLQGGILGDFTVENGAINFTISGAATRDGNQWGVGPYAVDRDSAGVISTLFQPVSKTAALRMQITTVAPPEPTNGARPLLDSSRPDLTSIAGIEGTTAMEADFTATPAATGPVWWDFGDGSWDYVAAPGATDHVYDTPGTYTVLASQNGKSWTSTTVTVPFP